MWKSLVVVLALCTSGCLPIWQGKTMQEDIEALRAEQQAIISKSASEREELTAMVASAREDVAELRDVLAEARELLQRNSADLGVEVAATREDLNRLRGTVEELDFRFMRMEQSLELFRRDVDLRFESGEAIKLPEEPDELRQFGDARLAEQDYLQARRAYERFLERHGEDARANEVRFQLGEAFFAQSQWVSAIGEYQKVLEGSAPTSRQAQANLRIGQAFLQMGQCPNAEVFFETVVAEYPGSRAVAEARRGLEQARSGSCP
ncbi:tetratricopeptide repeat protein [Lujinxingia vulgaris]|uniref:Tetratricopeptide repeat protein n=1 Tax=Lujinxingia vulgaris TaxID=2600176 RepID=A0A5C6X5W6_9DELT|nr:tetratricopeptide repeat protein [Lujinxingia vulgaris]TXD34474.1 tetratricopeptide repeat protein [Lujinxingia vulgaris]